MSQDVQHIRDLIPDPKNARSHNPRNIGMIADAMQEVGAARSIVIDENNIILAGNGAIEAAAQAGITDVRIIEASGNEIIAVRRSGLTPAQKTRLALFDNRAAELAEWDVERLKGFADEGYADGLFTSDELVGLLSDAQNPTGEDRPTMADRFLFPPFSVLDARSGEWQARKAAWLALGIQSELGRGDSNGAAAPSGSLMPAATLGSDGHTVRGDGRGRPA
jgi:hypothetical protein